ncbi:hypothetical protein [Ezakiella coagulans]|uniref:hypothetical protein n=1 Tax=Ezakiella coagulans TaxID=46507 RepID=UPI00288C3BC7|nr:hypothetical protein [Ezakiella coagulans]
MDRKAITISLAIIAATLAFVFAQSEAMIAVTSTVIFALMAKGFVEMYKDVRAILNADKAETKEELRKNVFK